MRLSVFVTCLLVAANVGTSLAEETEPRSQADDNRLFELINAIRENEARYHSLETVVRIRTKWEAEPQLSVNQQEEIRHTFEHGELFWFHSEETHTLASGERIKSERLTAFDGEFTRSIEFGNSVNVHTGRYEPPRMVPPHGWAIFQLRVSSLPLSVYLSGMRAIQEHPKAFHSPAQRGRTFEFVKVETEIEGEETIDELKCVKLRCRCWNRDGEAPTTELLWLATERNYLCVRSQWFIDAVDRERPFQVSKVTEMREVAHGLWLPMRVEVRHAKRDSQGKPAADVDSIETWTVEKANDHPEDLSGRLRDVKLPADLPRFDIGEDGRLDTSGVDLAKAEPRDPRELAEIIDKLREEERRYERLDVSLSLKYRTFGAENFGMSGVHLTSKTNERTVAMRGKLFSTHRLEYHTAGMGDRIGAETSAWDGHWLRRLYWQAEGSQLPGSPTRITLAKHGPRFEAYRPHTALFWRQSEMPLSELLTVPWYNEQNKYGYQVSYLGDEKVDGLSCKLLRLGHVSSGRSEPSSFTFLWLCSERNYLPIRSETCDPAWSNRLPTGSTYVAKWQELKPGLWLPYHVVALGYDHWGRHGIGSGQIVVQSRADRQVKRATIDADVSDDLFAPAAPAGKVNVVDAIGYTIGEIRQRDAGPATVTDDKWRIMAAAGPHDAASMIQRQTAQKALFGRPAPELVGERWLNGEPQTWESLAGKTVILFFWAEWFGESSGQLAQLVKEHQGLVESGVVVIGVHPAGSRPEEIQTAVKEFKLTWTICVDQARSDGHPWGALYENMQVQYLPDAFIIDGQGRIAAQGQVAEMAAKARELVKKP